MERHVACSPVLAPQGKEARRQVRTPQSAFVIKFREGVLYAPAAPPPMPRAKERKAEQPQQHSSSSLLPLLVAVCSLSCPWEVCPCTASVTYRAPAYYVGVGMREAFRTPAVGGLCVSSVASRACYLGFQVLTSTTPE